MGNRLEEYLLVILVYFCIFHIKVNESTYVNSTTVQPLHVNERTVQSLFVNETTVSNTVITNEKELERLREIYDSDKYCNKTWFTENYILKGKYMNLLDLYLLCNDTFRKRFCKQPTMRLSVKLVEYMEQEAYILVCYIEKIQIDDPGCWGIAYETASLFNHKETKYFNVNRAPPPGDENNTIYKMNTKMLFNIHYMVGAIYEVRVSTLPPSNVFNFRWKAPGPCELEVLHEFYRKMRSRGLYKNCTDEDDLPDLFTISELARYLCKNFTTERRREIVKKQLEMQDKKINQRCNLVLKNSTDEEAIEVETNIIIPVAGAFGVVLLGVCFFVIMARRNDWKVACNSNDTIASSAGEQLLHYDSSLRKEQQIAMILHRPGCEILESLVIEFSGLLRSYGIEMNMTLVDQSVVDEEGGIASYLHRTLDQCQYVLILLTENSSEQLILKHRPYEFALKMLEGKIVYSSQSTIEYIPLYLTSFQEMVEFFPPFLKASSSYGFKLPNETTRLISTLLGLGHNTKKLKERHIKDQTFLKKMKELSKSYLQKEHKNCLAENCTKGAAYSSTTNLSSIWASTVYSMNKWPSVRSNKLLVEIDEHFDDDVSKASNNNDLYMLKKLDNDIRLSRSPSSSDFNHDLSTTSNFVEDINITNTSSELEATNVDNNKDRNSVVHIDSLSNNEHGVDEFSSGPSFIIPIVEN